MIFNGSGKTRDELEYAVKHGVLVNIESMFDLYNITDAAKKVERNARLLLKIDPNA